MKNPLFIAFMLLVTNLTTSLAQDLIVTTNNDSIKCNIIRLRDSWVYYKMPKDTNKRELQIPCNEVKQFQFGYYKNQHGVLAQQPVVMVNIADASYLHRFEMGLTMGYAFRTASLGNTIPTSLQSYYKSLLDGIHVNATAGYFFNDRMGVGLCYSYSNYVNALTGYFINNTTNTTYYGTLSDNIDIQYVAPEFLFRTKVARTNWCIFNGGIQLGYLWYVQNTGTPDIKHYTYTGSTGVLNYNLGFDFKVAPQLGFTFRVAYVIASLSQMQVDDGTKITTVTFQTGQYENLNCFDLSAGLKLYLGKVKKH